MRTLSEESPVKKEEEYLINQSPDLSVGVNDATGLKLKTFPAFQNNNFRLYFLGQLVSVIGTWLQIVAEGWLVLQLANSPFLIGLVAALATTPAMLFSLFGGVIVDRFSKKRILFATQSAALVLAMTLGILTVMGEITIPMICIIAFLLGTVNAVDAPARQAFINEVVNKDELPSAIALNSGIFNAGRVIGPGIAGLLIAFVGTGGAFIINGVSYLAVIIALYYMNIEEKPVERKLDPIKAIKDGVKYSFSHPVIRVLLIFSAVVSIFGWSYTTIMPVIAQNIFHIEAKGLGYLYSATGLGSLLATYFVSAYAKKVSPIVFILGGNTLFALSLILFSFSNSLMTALPLLFLAGLGLLSQSATMTTMLQTMVKEEFRGRVMSIYILMFLGMAPIGNFEIGFLTEKLGISYAITFNAIIVIIFGGYLFSKRRKVKLQYLKYKKAHPAPR